MLEGFFCCQLAIFEGLQVANKKCQRRGFRWKVSGISLVQIVFELKGKTHQVDYQKKSVFLQEIGIELFNSSLLSFLKK